MYSREGLVALANALFVFDVVKSVVQVRTKEDVAVDRTKIYGTEISLRTIEFQNVPNIEPSLKELEEKGCTASGIRFNNRSYLGSIRVLVERSQRRECYVGHLWHMAKVSEM